MTPPLLHAVLLAAFLVGVSPFIIRWAYQDWNADLVALAVAPVLPLLVFAGATLWQERHGRPSTTFAASPLSTVLCLMSAWVVGTALVGYFVVVLGLAVLPVSAAYLALAWVQPHPDHKALTVTLGVAAVPFAIWFAARADEHLSEALISGVALIAIVAVMFSMRRTRISRSSTAVA